MVCALVVNTALGGATPVLPGADKLPLVIINFGLVLLVGGPLGEEFGWRGYALSALTARLGWRAASLIIGVVWAAWHLPLFFMAGTAQAQMPIALFMINITASSVGFSWLFARSGRSVWPVIVGHTSLNLWAGLLILPLGAGSQAYALVTALVVLIALALLVRGDGLKARAPCSRPIGSKALSFCPRWSLTQLRCGSRPDRPSLCRGHLSNDHTVDRRRHGF
jgi:membrane protease YdiL (CAAX protease family)